MFYAPKPNVSSGSAGRSCWKPRNKTFPTPRPGLTRPFRAKAIYAAALPWMATSEGGHDVFDGGLPVAVQSVRDDLPHQARESLSMQVVPVDPAAALLLGP